MSKHRVIRPSCKMRNIKKPVNRYFLETNVLRKQDVKGNVI